LQKVISEGSSDAGFPWLVHCPSSNADLILLWLRAPLLVPRSGVAAATVILGCEALGAETFGAETFGAETLGAETLGAEALGAEALGPEALGPEDSGVETTLGTDTSAVDTLGSETGGTELLATTAGAGDCRGGDATATFSVSDSTRTLRWEKRSPATCRSFPYSSSITAASFFVAVFAGTAGGADAVSTPSSDFSVSVGSGRIVCSFSASFVTDVVAVEVSISFGFSTSVVGVTVAGTIGVVSGERA
jgi:hypothetical protein